MNFKLATLALCVMISSVASAQAKDDLSAATERAQDGTAGPTASSRLARLDEAPHWTARVGFAAGLGLLPAAALTAAAVVLAVNPPPCRGPGSVSLYCSNDGFDWVALFALLSPPVTAGLVTHGHAVAGGKGHLGWAILGASLGMVTGGVAGYLLQMGFHTAVGTVPAVRSSLLGPYVLGPIIGGLSLSAICAVLFAEIGHARALRLEKVPQLGFAPMRGGGVITAGMQF